MMSYVEYSSTVASVEGSNKRAKTSHPEMQPFDFTDFLSTVLCEWSDGKVPLLLATLVLPYLTVTELVASRSVSLQWHRLFSHAGCGSALWPFTPTESQLEKLAQREVLMTSIDTTLLDRLGCQRNIMQSLPPLSSLNLVDGYESECCRREEICVHRNYTLNVRSHLEQCSNLPLQQLVADCHMTTAIFAAAPQLIEINCAPGDDYHDTLDVFITHAPPTIKHCAWLGGELHAALVPSLAQRFASLESLSISVDEWEINSHLFTLLAACTNLEILQMDAAVCNTELMDTLVKMPKLCKLELESPDDVTKDFLYRSAELRIAMTSHLCKHQQREQLDGTLQHIELHLRDVIDIPSAEHDQTWWHAAVQADPFYTTLELLFNKIDGLSMARFDPGAYTLPKSPLLGDMKGHSDHQEAVQHYAVCHIALNFIRLPDGHELSDDQLLDVVSQAKYLEFLSLSCTSPAIVHQALREGESIDIVHTLDISWPRSTAITADETQLAACLQLVKATTAMAEVTIRCEVTEFLELSVAELTRCTEHVSKVHIVSAVAESTATQCNFVTRMLLMLPKLATLNDTQIMTLDLVLAIRAENGLSPVQFS